MNSNIKDEYETYETMKRNYEDQVERMKILRQAVLILTIKQFFRNIFYYPVRTFWIYFIHFLRMIRVETKFHWNMARITLKYAWKKFKARIHAKLFPKSFVRKYKQSWDDDKISPYTLEMDVISVTKIK